MRRRQQRLRGPPAQRNYGAAKGASAWRVSGNIGTRPRIIGNDERINEMCVFFSCDSSGGHLYYFDWEIRKKIISGELDLEPDSHSSIAAYFCP